MDDAAERVAGALERIAAALERIATEPSGTLPARRSKARRAAAVKAATAPIDEVTQRRARKALERAGLR